MNDLTKGGVLVVTERSRQIFEEGFTPHHDMQYINAELPKAAVVYASVPVMRHEEPGADTEAFLKEAPSDLWPWDAKWWKPGTDIECLVKAGALIIAEIDRRLEANEGLSQSEAVRG